MTPVHKTVQVGISSEENADTFKKLDAAREAGDLAGSRELAAEGATLPTTEMREVFAEKSEKELMKLNKADLLKYAMDFAAAAEKIAEAKAEHAAQLAKVAAIHGIPRGKIGEAIEAMLESNPDHPGRGIPYPLVDEEGQPRVTAKDRRRKGVLTPKGTAVTRMDN
jgi:hypothetical protein